MARLAPPWRANSLKDRNKESAAPAGSPGQGHTTGLPTAIRMTANVNKSAHTVTPGRTFGSKFIDHLHHPLENIKGNALWVWKMATGEWQGPAKLIDGCLLKGV